MSATDYGWQIGGLWKLTDRDSIGLNYRAKIRSHPERQCHLPRRPLATGFDRGARQFRQWQRQADFDTPYTAVLSYWHQGDRIGLGADVSRTGWSSFKELRVKYGSGQPDTVEPENWRDTSYVSVGGDYRLSNQWTVRAGLAYDQTPTRDSTRTPRVPDGARRWLSFGLDYTLQHRCRIQFRLRASVGGRCQHRQCRARHWRPHRHHAVRQVEEQRQPAWRLGYLPLLRHAVFGDRGFDAAVAALMRRVAFCACESRSGRAGFTLPPATRVEGR